MPEVLSYEDLVKHHVVGIFHYSLVTSISFDHLRVSLSWVHNAVLYLPTNMGWRKAIFKDF